MPSLRCPHVANSLRFSIEIGFSNISIQRHSFYFLLTKCIHDSGWTIQENNPVIAHTRTHTFAAISLPAVKSLSVLTTEHWSKYNFMDCAHSNRQTSVIECWLITATCYDTFDYVGISQNYDTHRQPTPPTTQYKYAPQTVKTIYRITNLDTLFSAKWIASISRRYTHGDADAHTKHF